jgi:thiol-disulfide isomerase/thioredoxin
MITDNTLHTAPIPYEIGNAYSFSEFVALTAEMVAQNTTTGPVKSESRINATKLNLQRLNRVAKTMQLLPEWSNVAQEKADRFVFLAITETWCGDGAQILPVIHRIAAHFNIPLQIILRDAYPDIADNYLFRGTRSIPKLVVFDKLTGKELGHWGPRPAEAQQIVDDAKVQGIAHDDYVITLQNWYNQNKTVSLQRELLAFMQQLL